MDIVMEWPKRNTQVPPRTDEMKVCTISTKDGSSNKIRNVYERILQSRLGTSCLEQHRKNKHVSLGRCRMLAINHGVPLPTHEDLKAHDFKEHQVDVGRWVIPEDCKRQREKIGEEGECSGLCGTCAGMASSSKSSGALKGLRGSAATTSTAVTCLAVEVPGPSTCHNSHMPHTACAALNETALEPVLAAQNGAVAELAFNVPDASTGPAVQQQGTPGLRQPARKRAQEQEQDPFVEEMLLNGLQERLCALKSVVLCSKRMRCEGEACSEASSRSKRSRLSQTRAHLLADFEQALQTCKTAFDGCDDAATSCPQPPPPPAKKGDQSWICPLCPSMAVCLHQRPAPDPSEICPEELTEFEEVAALFNNCDHEGLRTADTPSAASGQMPIESSSKMSRLGEEACTPPSLDEIIACLNAPLPNPAGSSLNSECGERLISCQ